MAASSIGLLVGASLGAACLGSQLAKTNTARHDAARLMQMAARSKDGAMTTAAIAAMDAASSSRANTDDTAAISNTAMTIAMRFAPYGGEQSAPEQNALMAQNITALRTTTDMRTQKEQLIRTSLVLSASPMDAQVLSDHPARPAPAMNFKAHTHNDADCLAQAVYYEARGEGDDGMRAVAQVILNRVRHPAFPKTICAVVYQGALQRTGCQFSFACDGAMAAPLEAWAWRRSKQIADAALAGYVMKAVGTSTHFHTLSVSPVWEGNMVRITTIGSHVFYQFRGRDSQIRNGDVQPSDAMPSVIQASDTVTAPDMASVPVTLASATTAADAATSAPRAIQLSAHITGKSAEDVAAALTANPTGPKLSQ